MPDEITDAEREAIDAYLAERSATVVPRGQSGEATYTGWNWGHGKHRGTMIRADRGLAFRVRLRKKEEQERRNVVIRLGNDVGVDKRPDYKIPVDELFR